MKKNLAPLLVIAVVVAVLATAIFYGLVVGKLGTVAASDGGHSDAAAGPPPKPEPEVAAGMRAVSVRVAESSGVVGLLKPGSRVDVQAVLGLPGDKDVHLRTVAEAIAVLEVGPAVESRGRVAEPVVTLLAKPAEAESIALADTGARVRLALRNPEDAEQENRPTQSLWRLIGATPTR